MLKRTVLLAAAGLLGAAIFSIGSNAPPQPTCPWPSIDSAYAPPIVQFVRDTLIGGTLNAALLVSLGWVAWGIVRTVKGMKPNTIGSIS